jgi:hypothetical protein
MGSARRAPPFFLRGLSAFESGNGGLCCEKKAKKEKKKRFALTRNA